jgi:hypothetical protein
VSVERAGLEHRGGFHVEVRGWLVERADRLAEATLHEGVEARLGQAALLGRHHPLLLDAHAFGERSQDVLLGAAASGVPGRGGLSHLPEEGGGRVLQGERAPRLPEVRIRAADLARNGDRAKVGFAGHHVGLPRHLGGAQSPLVARRELLHERRHELCVAGVHRVDRPLAHLAFEHRRRQRRLDGRARGRGRRAGSNGREVGMATQGLGDGAVQRERRRGGRG